MTFVLRHISKRASGGEIVRERDLADGPLRIGRGADCEIRIADLAVSLHHATLSMDGGKVRIDSAGDQPFGVDGKFVHSASVKPADNAVLTFGDTAPASGISVGLFFYSSGLVFGVSAAVILAYDLCRVLTGAVSDEDLIAVKESDGNA